MSDYRSDYELDKLRESSWDALLSYFFSEDEMRAYEARKQLCWEALKCKKELDEEIGKIIESRQLGQKYLV